MRIIFYFLFFVKKLWAFCLNINKKWLKWYKIKMRFNFFWEKIENIYIYIFANNFEKLLISFLRNEKESQNGAKTICQTLPSFSRHFTFPAPSTCWIFYLYVRSIEFFLGVQFLPIIRSFEFFRQNFMVHVRL
jgi:hypothetical protein